MALAGEMANTNSATRESMRLLHRRESLGPLHEALEFPRTPAGSYFYPVVVSLAVAAVLLLTSPSSIAVGRTALSMMSLESTQQLPTIESNYTWYNLTKAGNLGNHQLGYGWYTSQIVYDPVLGSMVTIDYASNTMWAFRGGVWKELPTLHPPSPSFYGNLVYDAHDGYLVFCGGVTNTTSMYPLNNTWVLTNGSWTNITATAGGPSCGLATYDAADGYIVTFGQYNISYSETWAFQGGHWTKLHTKVNPLFDSGTYDLTYDAHDGYVLLAGDAGRYGTIYNGSWAFSNGQWTQLFPSAIPSDPFRGILSYDSSMGVTLTVGVNSDPCYTYGTTWTYQADNWTRLKTNNTPELDVGTHLAYDPADGYELALERFSTNSYETFVLTDKNLSSTTNVTASARACIPPIRSVHAPAPWYGNAAVLWVGVLLAGTLIVAVIVVFKRKALRTRIQQFLR